MPKQQSSRCDALDHILFTVVPEEPGRDRSAFAVGVVRIANKARRAADINQQQTITSVNPAARIMPVRDVD